MNKTILGLLCGVFLLLTSVAFSNQPLNTNISTTKKISVQKAQEQMDLVVKKLVPIRKVALGKQMMKMGLKMYTFAQAMEQMKTGNSKEAMRLKIMGMQLFFMGRQIVKTHKKSKAPIPMNI